MGEVEISVTPRSAQDRVGPYRDRVLQVRTTRIPADGDANRAVVRLVADALDLAPSRVTVVAGARGRRKRLRIEGLDAAGLERRLAAIGTD